MCDTILPRRGYATAVNFFAFDECIELVSCHDFPDVTVVSLFIITIGIPSEAAFTAGNHCLGKNV